jgi:hypothetical protein
VSFTIPGFVENNDQTITTRFQPFGEVGSCDDKYLFLLETTDFLRSGVVFYQEAFSLYMFGDSLATFQSVEEEWYNIKYSEDQIDFTVDKSIDSLDYTVDVRLVRSR